MLTRTVLQGLYEVQIIWERVCFCVPVVGLDASLNILLDMKDTSNSYIFWIWLLTKTAEDILTLVCYVDHENIENIPNYRVHVMI